MTIELYNTADNHKVLNKTLTAIKAVDVTLLTPVNVRSINLVLNNNLSIDNANYIYCSYFKRYYYINTVNKESGGRTVINCECDVLMSFNKDINNLNVLVTRQENVGINNIIDTALPILGNKKMKVAVLSEPLFNINTASDADYNFLLTIAGRQGS